jgi:hypothetical protein
MTKDHRQTPTSGRSSRPELLRRRKSVTACTTGTRRQNAFDGAKAAAYRSIGLLADRFPAWRWRDYLPARDCGWMAHCAHEALPF